MMEIFFAIPIVAIIMGVSFAAYEASLKHKREMAKLRNNENPDNDTLASEYQEFVLGVDARIQRLEDRIRLLEGRLRQDTQSDETQQIRRG